MRLIRLILALALLKVGFWLLDRADGLRAEKPGLTVTRYRPVDLMLLGSIAGLAICTVWIWIVARAGR
jgi:hypothetical protein